MEHTTSDTDIFRKTTEVLDKLEQNQQLQQMAYENGIDTKNSCRLTAATKENIAVSVVSMLLAKQNNDPLCNDLVRFGMQHRNTKAQIVNKYKNEANALIKRYRNGEKPEEKIEVITIKSEAFLDNDIPDIYNEYYFTSWSDKVVQEGAGKVVALGVAGVLALPFVLISKAINLIVTLIDKFIGLFTRISPERLLKKLEKIPKEKRDTFTMTFNEGEILALTASSAAFCKALDLTDIFCDNVSDAMAADQLDARINKWSQDLVDELDKLPTYRELNVDINSNKQTISYDDAVSLLRDLSRLNMTDVKNRSKRLKKVLSKVETVSSKQQAETHEGLTKFDIALFKMAINAAVKFIQKWIDGRNKILRTASRTIDTNGQPASANAESISESYQEFIHSSVGQYYLEEDEGVDLGGFPTGAAIAAGTALGVVGLAVWLVTLPFRIIIGVLRAIVRFIKSIINSFRTFDVDKTLRMMERIPQDKRDMFALELDGGVTNLTLILSTVSIQELINQFDELSKNTSDVKSIDMKKWRELQDAVTAINQGQRVGKLGNRILNWTGTRKSGLPYDAAKELLMSLKNIDVKAFASKVNDFNRLIEQKTREMKKAEAEARAAGGATNSNTDQMKSDADEIQRIGNNVLSTVQKWSSSTTTLLKSANAYVYQYNNNTGWERDAVMKNGRTK